MNESKLTPTTSGTEPTEQPGNETENLAKSKSQAFNIVLEKAKLLAGAMGDNLEALAVKGVTEAYVNDFKAVCLEVDDLYEQQANLKADKKECTDTLVEKFKQLKTAVRDGTYYVKMALPPRQWVGCGVNHKS